MNKKLCILISIFLITIFPTISFANEVAYDLKNGYIAVKEEVFNTLVKNDKLNNVYVIEIDRQKDVISKLNIEFNNKDKLNNEKVATLNTIIDADKNIISAQNENIKSYEAMFNVKKDENKNLKGQLVFYKVLLIGVGTAAITQIDSVGWKIVSGAGLASLTLFEWKF